MVMAAHISRAPDLQITNRQQWISFAEDKKSEEGREREKWSERKRETCVCVGGVLAPQHSLLIFFFLLNRKPV